MRATLASLRETLGAIEHQKALLFKKIAKHDEHIAFIRSLPDRVGERKWTHAKDVGFHRGRYYIMRFRSYAGGDPNKVFLFYCWRKVGHKRPDGTRKRSITYLSLKMGQDHADDRGLIGLVDTMEVWALPEDVQKPIDTPCPYCGRENNGKWFTPCPSDDCPSNETDKDGDKHEEVRS